MKTFTKDFIKENSGCYGSEQLAKCSFMQQEGSTVILENIVKSEIPLMDKFWFVCKKVATLEENKQLAIRCAEIVLPIYEKCYPGNIALRQAIEAIKLYIAGHISKSELISKKRTVADAYYAAYRTHRAAYVIYYAVTYAADAAIADDAYYAADDAYYAAAYAAHDATYAAYAAAWAVRDAAVADDINLNEQLLQILIDYYQSA